jgi:hypothetical protein
MRTYRLSRHVPCSMKDGVGKKKKSNVRFDQVAVQINTNISTIEINGDLYSTLIM